MIIFSYIGKDHVNNEKTLRWTVDNNYIRTKEDVYPRRAKSAINRQSLKVNLYSDKEDVALRKCNIQAGFRIMLHHPAESPRKSTRDLQLLFENYNILVKPEITTTSSDLINYAPHRRKCYFSHERPLKFFKIYTERNCQTECLANYTLSECHCAPYYMPREKSTRICGLNEFYCLEDAESEIFSNNVNLN
jgi:amiloride-sensitive sodium channel